MLVTDDEYELPLIVADNIPELSRRSGADARSIRSAISRVDRGKIKKSIYRKVEVE